MGHSHHDLVLGYPFFGDQEPADRVGGLGIKHECEALFGPCAGDVQQTAGALDRSFFALVRLFLRVWTKGLHAKQRLIRGVA